MLSTAYRQRLTARLTRCRPRIIPSPYGENNLQDRPTCKRFHGVIQALVGWTHCLRIE